VDTSDAAVDGVATAEVVGGAVGLAVARSGGGLGAAVVETGAAAAQAAQSHAAKAIPDMATQ